MIANAKEAAPVIRGRPVVAFGWFFSDRVPVAINSWMTNLSPD